MAVYFKTIWIIVDDICTVKVMFGLVYFCLLHVHLLYVSLHYQDNLDNSKRKSIVVYFKINRKDQNQNKVEEHHKRPRKKNTTREHPGTLSRLVMD